MPHRIALAVEGPSDGAVLETICRRKGHIAKAAAASGRADLFNRFPNILQILDIRFQPTHYLVVADLQPETDCPPEAERWRAAIRKRFPKAELCLSIWELESWLLAEPSGVGRVLHRGDLKIPAPDRIGDPKPSAVLEDMFRQAREYVRGKAYDKEADGARIAEELDLDLAGKNSHSLAHFLRSLETRQARLT